MFYISFKLPKNIDNMIFIVDIYVSKTYISNFRDNMTMFRTRWPNLKHFFTVLKLEGFHKLPSTKRLFPMKPISYATWSTFSIDHFNVTSWKNIYQNFTFRLNFDLHLNTLYNTFIWTTVTFMGHRFLVAYVATSLRYLKNMACTFAFGSYKLSSKSWILCADR